jgi:hypothetical protein
MKAEIINLPEKGLCILISDIDLKDVNHPLSESISTFLSNGSNITNPFIIADAIREKKKILAIKELRAQTGWGLKDAKHYIDRWLPTASLAASLNDPHDPPTDEFFENQANAFIRDHTNEETFKVDDFNL